MRPCERLSSWNEEALAGVDPPPLTACGLGVACALVLSGELDAITPPRCSARIAARLTRGRHLVLPDRSHDDVDPCVGSMINHVLDTADPWTVPLACLEEGG